ncbi:MAG: hypothetical protein AB8H86_22105, partial [Polyangiales bacterium]
MSQYQLRARFESSKRATDVAERLNDALEAHAKEYDAAFDEGNECGNDAMRAFAGDVGFALEELALTWGDDGLSNDLPEVSTLHETLVFYHGFSKGGIGPELSKMLTAAGADVEEFEGPPVLFASLEPNSALVATLTAFFRQADDEEELSEWGPAPWQDEDHEEYEEDGESTDVAFHVEGDVCAFALPVQPCSFDSLSAYLAEHSK